MDFLETFLESLNTLTVNKLRTGLAILGIVIGIASVIALLSLGKSSQKTIENQVQSLGANLLTVSPGAMMQGTIRGAMGGRTSLTLDDAEAILSSPKVTTVKNVSPEYSSRTQVTAGRNNTNTQVYGVTSSYAEIRKTSLSSGSFISQSDVDRMTKVAVLGSQVVTDLFGEGTNPVGQTIRIKSISFKVIGVAASKGGSGFMNQDDVIYIPLTTAQKSVFGSNYLTSIAVEAKSKEVMTQTQNEIGYLLLDRHKINDPTQADFFIMSQNDILNAASSITGTFTALLSGIAAISLFVGGIGVMNIMLVAVTERTREIGLRKALGARKRRIIMQFLLESIILTCIGGILGIVLGILISFVFTKFLNLPFAVSPISLVLATGVSALVGIVFGWYPAKKAADLQPIEALRYE